MSSIDVAPKVKEMLQQICSEMIQLQKAHVGCNSEQTPCSRLEYDLGENVRELKMLGTTVVGITGIYFTTKNEAAVTTTRVVGWDPVVETCTFAGKCLGRQFSINPLSP